jgi:hypothetical protein
LVELGSELTEAREARQVDHPVAEARAHTRRIAADRKDAIR